jgi:predicted nucleic acid-binding protein
MKDKAFIDTNIFVYSALEDEEEKIDRFFRKRLLH